MTRNLATIITEVMRQENGVTLQQLCSRDRREPLVTDRHTFIYLCRSLGGYAWPRQRVARFIRRTSWLVRYAEQRVKDQKETNPLYSRRLALLEARCRAAINGSQL